MTVDMDSNLGILPSHSFKDSNSSSRPSQCKVVQMGPSGHSFKDSNSSSRPTKSSGFPMVSGSGYCMIPPY